LDAGFIVTYSSFRLFSFSGVAAMVASVLVDSSFTFFLSCYAGVSALHVIDIGVGDVPISGMSATGAIVATTGEAVGPTVL
jgi:hypothetical protein